MINVLYLSYDGMTDPLGQSQVIPYLQGLTKQGYRFTIISFEKPERFDEGKDQLLTLLSNSDIHWVPLPYHRKPPVLSTLYDVYILRKKAHELHRKENFSIVHCRSYITALIGMAMKRKFGSKFIFNMRGFWADERVEGGLWNLNNPIYKCIYSFFKRKETQMLSHADYTISLTHAADEVIQNLDKIPNRPIPIKIIPCCVDVELFDNSKIRSNDKEDLRGRLNIQKGQPVLTYLGSLGTWYPIEEMLNFFKDLLRSDFSYLFLFITKTPQTIVYEQVEKLNIPHSKIRVVSANRQEVPLYLSLSTFSVFFYYPTFSKKATSPTKMGEIMSMGIPLVTNRGIGDSDAIVQESGVGVLTNLFHYQEAIDRVMQSSALPTEQIRAAAITHFSLSKGVAAYHEVYQQLMENDEMPQALSNIIR